MKHMMYYAFTILFLLFLLWLLSPADPSIRFNPETDAEKQHQEILRQLLEQEEPVHFFDPQEFDFTLVGNYSRKGKHQ